MLLPARPAPAGPLAASVSTSKVSHPPTHPPTHPPIHPPTSLLTYPTQPHVVERGEFIYPSTHPPTHPPTQKGKNPLLKVFLVDPPGSSLANQVSSGVLKPTPGYVPPTNPPTQENIRPSRPGDNPPTHPPTQIVHYRGDRHWETDLQLPSGRCGRSLRVPRSRSVIHLPTHPPTHPPTHQDQGKSYIHPPTHPPTHLSLLCTYVTEAIDVAFFLLENEGLFIGPSAYPPTHPPTHPPNRGDRYGFLPLGKRGTLHWTFGCS